ncbi:MAG: Putative ABC transporter [Leptospirillum sp. Group II 'C75']|jgi:phospholipid/cholesterol/gamma-HCH transport system substrate-binding protein|uniref:MlaD family protein n=1 Tax=Leptospirillum sp. Group II 'CF-1' TaxID=1660083 RepID=UPI0000F0C98B|nr:MlaD family protein [Leptospirillum sp. Group II 'CF-1']AKS24445.1 ABC transporter [Leptospirillum sp. Group II 'CF-1']EAY58188.1 MAG: putative ABC transporter [Leptospirillum rubarum]EIJ76423.1 MAG: Putative ABC transporter [Leptospirillum sp. Group II 'C75']
MNWTAEAKLGFFIVVAILVAVGLTLRFGHFHLTPKGSYRIYADFRSVDGLEKGTAVRIAGVRVGEVTDITLRSSGMAHVEMMIFDGLKLPADIHPVIFSNGFLGKLYIELVPGKSAKPIIKKNQFFPTRRERQEQSGSHLSFSWFLPSPVWGDPLPSQPGASVPGPSLPSSKTEDPGYVQPGQTLASPGETVSVNRLVRKLNRIADDIKAITGALRRAMGNKKGTEDLKKTLDNLKVLTDNLRDFTKNLKDKSPAILKKVDSIATKIDQGVGTVGQLVNNKDLYNKVDSAAGHLDSILAKIDSGQGTIGQLVNNPDLYNNLNATLKKFSDLSHKSDQMVLDVSMKGYYFPRDAAADGFLTLQIFPRSDKFYEIQVVSSQLGNYNQTVPYTQVNGNYIAGPSQVTENNYAIKFSVEFGQKFNNFDVRAGMIENSFGVGTDVFLTDNLTFTFVLYNIGSYDPIAPNPFTRMYLNYTILNHIWLTAGWYNAFNQNLSSPLVGGGIVFSDNTLKTLIAGHLP